MTTPETQKEEKQSLSIWELVQGLFALLIGVQSKEQRERQMKYGKPHQFVIVGVCLSLLFISGMYFLMRFALRLAGV